jgi:hypothetical protein
VNAILPPEARCTFSSRGFCRNCGHHEVTARHCPSYPPQAKVHTKSRENLFLARSSSGRPELDLDLINLPLLSQASATAQSAAEAKGHAPDLQFSPTALLSFSLRLRDRQHQFASQRGGERRWAGERMPICFSLSQLGRTGRQGAAPALACRSPAAGAAHGGEGGPGVPTLRRVAGIIAYCCASFACLLLAKTFARDGEVVLASCCLSGAIGALMGLWLQIRTR